MALVICWPIWVYDAQFVFDDTPSYMRGGATIWRTLIDLWSLPVAGAEGGGTATPLAVDSQGRSTVGRSFTYSAAAYGLYWLAGPSAIALAQAVFVAVFVVALIDPAMMRRPGALSLGLLLVVGLTTLPWYSVYLIPDLFAAIPILFGALVLGPFRTAVVWQKCLFVALTALAASFHYGYPPLMAAVAGFALVWLLLTRALTLGSLIALTVTVGFAPILNLAASTAILDTPSTAPQRLPIPLARSLADGPAYWYLKDVCPQADLALCEAFGADIPEDIGAFLWAKDGVQSLDPALMARIRAEEVLVLARAFRAYPLQQTASLFGNAARQLVMVGTDEIRVATFGPDLQLQPVASNAPAATIVRAIEPALAWATWLGALPCLVLLVTGRLDRRHRAMVLIVLWGLLANAAIFGGLSAPVDRYQSRVIWLLPLLSALLVPAYLGRRSDPAM